MFRYLGSDGLGSPQNKITSCSTQTDTHNILTGTYYKQDTIAFNYRTSVLFGKNPNGYIIASSSTLHHPATPTIVTLFICTVIFYTSVAL